MNISSGESLDKIKVYLVFFPDEKEVFIADDYAEGMEIAKRMQRVLGLSSYYVIKEF